MQAANRKPNNINSYSLAPTMAVADVERVLDTLNKLNASGVRCLFGKWHSSDDNSSIHNKKTTDINYFFKDVRNAVKYSHRVKMPYTKSDHRLWDWYISINSFRRWHRSNQDVIGLNGLWCDIDLNEHHIQIPDFVIHIDEVLKLAKLPNPNLVTVSGHGVYFVWLFSKQMINNSKGFRHFWQRMEYYHSVHTYKKHGKKMRKVTDTGVVARVNSACKQIFGCEPVDTKATDTSRVLRLFGTNNMKNYRADHAKCRLIMADFHTYHMFDWADELLPKINYNPHRSVGHRHKRWKKRKHSKVITFRPHNHGPMSLFWSRHDDMEHLAKVAQPGIRENLLFYLACFDSKIKTTDGMDKDVEAANDSMPEPLPQSEITNLEQEYRHIDFTQYKFTNSTIIKALSLSAKFQRDAETIKEKRYRHQSKWQKRQAAKAEHRKERKLRHRKINELLTAGLSVRKVHKKLHVSVGLVSKINQMRKRRAGLQRQELVTPKNMIHHLMTPHPKPEHHYSPPPYRPPHEKCPYFKIRFMLLNDIPMDMISDKLNVTNDLVEEVNERWNTDAGKQKLLARIIQLERQKHGI